VCDALGKLYSRALIKRKLSELNFLIAVSETNDILNALNLPFLHLSSHFRIISQKMTVLFILPDIIIIITNYW